MSCPGLLASVFSGAGRSPMRRSLKPNLRPAFSHQINTLGVSAHTGKYSADCFDPNQDTTNRHRHYGHIGGRRNAGDMIRKQTLRYNRTRQAMITNEPIEIISALRHYEDREYAGLHRLQRRRSRSRAVVYAWLVRRWTSHPGARKDARVGRPTHGLAARLRWRKTRSALNSRQRCR